MDKATVRRFFDECAPRWDEEMLRSDALIAHIFNGARVGQGSDVLDVACGTGVLFPDYLARGAAHITGIDLSPEMARIARAKAADGRVEVICGDVETFAFEKQFDCVVVYNAFPHFPDPRRALDRLGCLVKPGGTLTVAHGMSREALHRHHAGAARDVSVELPECGALAALFAPEFTVTVQCSDERMYQVTGVKTK